MDNCHCAPRCGTPRRRRGVGCAAAVERGEAGQAHWASPPQGGETMTTQQVSPSVLRDARR
eukprot:1340935-Pleurochrysis_carterae.AAC.1